MNHTKEEVSITHVFDARREVVFNAWTDPEQLAKWYAPENCSIRFLKLDPRKGGSFHSCIDDPIHGDCWCKGTYLEYEFPEKLVFTMQLTDEHGNDVSSIDAGKPGSWPAITTVTILFYEQNIQTRMILHQTVSETLAKETGAYHGWIQMFKQLENLL